MLKRLSRLTMQRLVALLIFPFASLAQGWGGLATNFDGSVLYFASTARQARTQQTFHSKIYRWDAARGVQVVAEQIDEGQSAGCFTTSTFFNLIAPQVGLDGTLLGYTATRPNPGPIRFCSPDEPNQGTVLPAKTLPGRLALSANGRYAVTSPVGANVSGYHLVTDLNIGAVTLAEGAFNGAPQQVTDAGAVLTAHDYAAALTLPNGQSRVILTQRAIDTAIIDRAGRTVFYSSLIGPSTAAYVASVDVASGQELQIDIGLSFQGLSVTADGSTLLYAGNNDLRTVMLGSAIPRVVAQGSYRSTIISGDGRVAYGIGPSGSLLRIDLGSGGTAPIAPPTLPTNAYLVSGSPVTDVGAGSVLTIATANAFTVASVCGQVPPQNSKLANNQFQIAIDQPEGACTVVLASGGFESAIDLQIHQLLPNFIYNGQVYHANFQPVSIASPAIAGEVLIALMTGLGAVDPNDLLQNQLACTFDNQPADILYAGIAPSYLGLYQVNMGVPNLFTNSASLVCRFPADPAPYAQTGVPIGPVP